MFDAEAGQRFFNQMHEFYIQPELERRRLEGRLPDDFQIQNYLVRLPINQPPIVEFNDEFGWEVTHPKLAPGVNLEPGRDVYIYDIVEIANVIPPMVDEKRGAFIFCFLNGQNYEIIFDFVPNDP